MIVSTNSNAGGGTNPGALKPSLAKTDHDNLLLRDGRKVGAARDLAAVLVAAGVPGASAEKGRADNAAAYAAFLTKIHDDAGRAAVAAWLAGKGEA